MADREKILRYFKASGDENLAAKLLDLCEGANKSRKYKLSDFLDPHSLNVAEIIAANFERIKVETSGGFKNSERAKAAFVSEDFYGNPDYAIDAYKVEWDKRYYTLGHQDILGAFMGLGCKREILGDIIFIPEGAQFVADRSFNAYIVSNLTQIGAAPVQLVNIPLTDLQEKEEQVKIISATVAALRLDAVAAAGYGASRSRMADEIKGQNVKVNWKEAKNAAQTVGEGDIISYRGRGRVELLEVRGTTKKGRTSITLKRYI
ncbi:MAG: YlmH/Sll1252 family protein [Acidaminococcaceae bacterium]|nr:YlmH/Sll1252 family protein [Acidaminococcaceae bacterium]